MTLTFAYIENGTEDGLSCITCIYTCIEDRAYIHVHVMNNYLLIQAPLPHVKTCSG